MYFGVFFSFLCNTVARVGSPFFMAGTRKTDRLDCLFSFLLPVCAARAFFCFFVARIQVALQAHLRSMRQKQSVSFVTGLFKKYLGSFGTRGRFSVRNQYR